MGDVKNYPPCVRLVGAFSQQTDALEWLWNRVESVWGSILLKSPEYDFVESQYYEKSMGAGLKKQFAICSFGYDPGELSKDKLLTNGWETEFAQSYPSQVERPLNIDPGYLSLTKLVLASTKNREHRLYLQDGIYGEVTLAFRNQAWQSMEWTYPDYQRTDFQSFFTSCRQQILKLRT